MRHLFTLALLLSLCARNLQAQLTIHAPVVNTGAYAITDTVYMAPDGDDSNPGTLSKPVRTFSRALNLIPFKGYGLHSYGLIRLLPGVYYTATGFIQDATQWKKDGAYKNVSVEGIGDVLIQGPSPAQPATNHLLWLSGSHIFIRNIRLKYGNLNGVYIKPHEGRIQDVLIEHVQVDSVKSFGMLIEATDRVEVSYSAARYSARVGEEELPEVCQWPSGIKFFGCTHATIHHSEVAYTRGEGLDFQNTLYGKAYRNTLHDNPTQFYSDNSARLLIYQNYLYNTPDIGDRYWKTCPKRDDILEAGKAFLIANEGACMRGQLPHFEGCYTKCISPEEVFSNTDSLFIFNNFIQNSGRFLDFWQGGVNVIGVNCIKNVFIWHNTFIGTLQKNNHRIVIVNFFFPDWTPNHGALLNVRIQNNIFAFHPDNNIPLYEAFNFSIPANERDYLLASNIWSKVPPLSSKVLGSNIGRTQMRHQLPLLGDTALHYVVPGVSLPGGDTLNRDFFHPVSAITPGVMVDYRGLPRNHPLTNAGAFELQSSVSTFTAMRSERLRLYPVPPTDELWLDLPVEYLQDEFMVEIYDLHGQSVSQVRNTVHISCNHLRAGVYHIVARGKTWISQGTFVKVR
jgi:hypothetical protein